MIIEGLPNHTTCYTCEKYDWADHTRLVMLHGVIRDICDSCYDKADLHEKEIKVDEDIKT